MITEIRGLTELPFCNYFLGVVERGLTHVHFQLNPFIIPGCWLGVSGNEMRCKLILIISYIRRENQTPVSRTLHLQFCPWYTSKVTEIVGSEPVFLSV